MLGTFDLGDADVRSPDEILATLDPVPVVSGANDPPKAPASDDRAAITDVPDVEDVQSDEILRELEEHHRRGQTIARPTPPRGSAELQPISRRNAPPTRKRKAAATGSGDSKPRGGRARLVPILAAAALFTASASAVTLSQLSGAGGRPRTHVGSGRLVSATALAFAPTKIFDSMFNGIARTERDFGRRVTSPAKRRRRTAIVGKRSARHHRVTHTAVAPAASTSPVSSTQSSSSASSAPPSSSQPATTTAATAASSASHQSQPAFGLGYSCPEQRSTEILQHPRSTVFCRRGSKFGKSLQTPT
jgi:hypothetical protein